MEERKINKIPRKTMNIKIHTKAHFWFVFFLHWHLVNQLIEFSQQEVAIIDLLTTALFAFLSDVVIYLEIQKINSYKDFLVVDDVGVEGFSGSDRLLIKWEYIDNIYLDKAQVRRSGKYHYFLFFELKDSYDGEIEVVIGEENSLNQKKGTILNVDLINSKKAHKMVADSFNLFKESN